MSRFSDYLASQCGNPRGVVGKIMTWSMNRINGFMYHGIVKNLDLSKRTKVLDIGFGNGYLESLIYKKKHCSIYGIDISEDMVKAATERNRQGIENGDIRLSVGDCCDLQFEDNVFDIVTTMNTIYFWNDTMKGMQEIYRVLKKDGVFYNAALTKKGLDKMFYTKNGFKKFTEKDYARMGRQAGFRKISAQRLGKYENRGMLIECSEAILQALIDGIGASAAAIWTGLEKLWDAIWEWFQSIDWGQLGEDILNGIAAGLSAGVVRIGDVISDAGESIVNGFKEFFGIHSPSRLMRDEIGKFLLPGVSVGVEDTSDQTADDINRAIDNMFTGVDVDAMQMHLNTAVQMQDADINSIVDDILAGIDMDTIQMHLNAAVQMQGAGSP